MGLFDSIASLFKDPTDEMVGKDEILEINRQERIGNNPNVFSRYGSQTVTYNEDGQPVINQQLSAPYDALEDQRLAFLQGGPAQFAPTQSTGNLGAMFEQFANRTGVNSPSPMSQALMNTPRYSPMQSQLPSNQPNMMSQGIQPTPMYVGNPSAGGGMDNFGSLTGWQAIPEALKLRDQR